MTSDGREREGVQRLVAINLELPAKDRPRRGSVRRSEDVLEPLRAVRKEDRAHQVRALTACCTTNESYLSPRRASTSHCADESAGACPSSSLRNGSICSCVSATTTGSLALSPTGTESMSAKTFELAARAVRQAVSETGGPSAVRSGGCRTWREELVEVQKRSKRVLRTMSVSSCAVQMSGRSEPRPDRGGRERSEGPSGISRAAARAATESVDAG